MKCEFCGVIYKHRQSLSRHLKADHSSQTAAATSAETAPHSLLCLACSCSCFKDRYDFISHLKTVHDVVDSICSKNFESLDEFRAWKKEIEGKTGAFYRTARTANNKASKIMKFECHRSGFYKPTGTGIRHLKSSGSRKIDGYCPSYLNLNIEKDGKCAVTYFEKHWGHDVERQHLFLTADEHVTNKISEVWNGKKKDQNNLLLRLKQETLDLTKMVAQQVENSMSVEEILAAKKLLTSVLPTMAAVRDIDGPNTKFNPQDNYLKRKIEPQAQFLNFHSTKKSKTFQSISKPDCDEKNKNVFNLMRSKNSESIKLCEKK